MAEIGGLTGLDKVKETIDPTSSKDLDTTPIAEAKSLFYLISISTSSQTKTLIMSISRDTSGIKDTVFSKIGSPLPAEVSAVESGGNVILRITNPNAFAITAEAIRFILEG